MASLYRRALSRIALQSRISHKSIHVAQTAVPMHSAVLRCYTTSASTTGLGRFRNWPKVSYSRVLYPNGSCTPVVPSIQNRGYAQLKASGGKTEADLLVEELQELYDNAKDEFEIATDSTSGATIYAASDRESARELLDQLMYVYNVYTDMTRSPASTSSESPPEGNESPISPDAQQANADRLEAGANTNTLLDANEALSGNSYVGIAPNYDPEYISVEVKEEVKKRVGQRVRELKSAVERLEEMASHE